MILTEKITIEKLKEIDNHYYPDRIKFCVDIKRNHELGIGQGRLFNDVEWIDKCMNVLKQWII